MKVPNRVLVAVMKMARNQPVSDEERREVIEWGRPAEDRRFVKPATPAEQEAR